MTTTSSSSSSAAEVAGLLWPAPWGTPHVTRRRATRPADASDRRAYLFPSARRPRLLVPVDVPGSARMLERLGGSSPLGRPARRVLERAVRTGALGRAPWPVLRVSATDSGADSIERYLSACLGTTVRVGVLLGTRRVNQKPVLPVFDVADGRLLAYAKVGHTDLTRSLVRREAAALRDLAGHRLRHLQVPTVLHHGSWARLEVLVLSPLPVDPGRRVSPSVHASAFTELSQLNGVSSAPLAETAFWSRVLAAVDDLPTASYGDRLRTAAHRIDDEHGTDPVHLGGWHGDWGDWNMGMHGPVLHVWDWERYEPDVPLGFDALHHAIQLVRPGERDLYRQERTFFGSVPMLLGGLGIAPEYRDLTLRLYLLHIASRYADSLRHGTTPALSRRTSWVLDQLDRLDRPDPYRRPSLAKGTP